MPKNFQDNVKVHSEMKLRDGIVFKVTLATRPKILEPGSQNNHSSHWCEVSGPSSTPCANTVGRWTRFVLDLLLISDLLFRNYALSTTLCDVSLPSSPFDIRQQLQQRLHYLGVTSVPGRPARISLSTTLNKNHWYRFSSVEGFKKEVHVTNRSINT